MSRTKRTFAPTVPENPNAEPFPAVWGRWVAESDHTHAEIEEAAGTYIGWCDDLANGRAALPCLGRIERVAAMVGKTSPEFCGAARDYDVTRLLPSAAPSVLHIPVPAVLFKVMHWLLHFAETQHRSLNDQCVYYIMEGIRRDRASQRKKRKAAAKEAL